MVCVFEVVMWNVVRLVVSREGSGGLVGVLCLFRGVVFGEVCGARTGGLRWVVGVVLSQVCGFVSRAVWSGEWC